MAETDFDALMRVYEALVRGTTPAKADLDKVPASDVETMRADIEEMKKNGIVAIIPD